MVTAFATEGRVPVLPAGEDQGIAALQIAVTIIIAVVTGPVIRLLIPVIVPRAGAALIVPHFCVLN